MSFDFSTLVTDRTQADVSRVKQIAEKIKNGTASESELAEFNSAAMKGAYNHTDLNRVTAAMEALKAKLEGYGYAVPGYQRIKVPHVLPEPEPTSRLPEGYTELTYIESTGTQYIDTGLKGKSTLRVKMKAQMIDNSIGTPFLFGARDSGTVAAFCMFFHTNSGAAWKCDYQTSANRYAFSNTVATKTGVLEIDANQNVWSVNGLSKTFTAATFTSNSNLVLLAVNTGGAIADHAPAKIFDCQIYDGGTLVRDYVPCTNSGGAVGLYDIANGVFYSNAGSGTFIAGEEVAAPVAASVSVASVVNNAEYDPHTWYEFDWPTPETMTLYLLNVAAIRSVLAVLKSTPKAPLDAVGFMAQEANSIEVILLDVYAQLLIMPTTFVACGEALCGGDNL